MNITVCTYFVVARVCALPAGAGGWLPSFERLLEIFSPVFVSFYIIRFVLLTQREKCIWSFTINNKQLYINNIDRKVLF